MHWLPSEKENAPWAQVPYLTEGEIKELKNCTGSIQWLETVGRIKANRNGQLPSDWYVTVICGGIVDDVKQSWEQFGA